ALDFLERGPFFGNVEARQHAPIRKLFASTATISRRTAGLKGSQAAARGISQCERHVTRGEDGPVLQNHGALDRVLQLAHIARPVVSQQQAPRFRADAPNGFLELAVVPVDEEIY